MKERLVSPYAKFRVYPDRKRHYYFTVFVFANRGDMIEAVNGSNHHQSRPSLVTRGLYNAITLPWIKVKPKGKRPLRDLGQIVFYRRRTGMGTISHEMTHAALHYVRYIKGTGECDIEEGGKKEEILATVVGELTRQFLVSY